MGVQHHTGRASAFPSPALLESAIRHLNRSELASLCEQLIDRMDAMDPDADLEPNGDELDGTAGEDDFFPHSYAWWGEPGCPVADPDMAVDDGDCDEDDDLEHDYRDQPTVSQGPGGRS